jgi:carbohydrate-selective porin OprB
MSKGESRVELNMVWQVTPYLALQPSVQYVFNPSNFYNPQAEVSGKCSKAIVRLRNAVSRSGLGVCAT